MSQPDQYPSSQAPNGANAAPVGSSVPADGSSGAGQPSYGQYLRPAYGAMDNQFPQDYDPYIFGRPDPEPQPVEAPQMGPGPAQQPNQAPMHPWAGQQAQTPHASGNTPQGGKYPRYVNGIDMEDPNQNIFYGRWDAGAIIAFVFAVFLPVPIMPAILGALSMRRTRIMRMKGYGLALAAVILNVLYTIAFVWLMINGVSMDDVMDQMIQSLNASTSGGSGDSVQA